MSKQYVPHSWSQLVAGIGMLAVAALIPFIRLANIVGLGKALGLVLVGLLVSAWVIIAVVFIARGIHKM